MKKHLALAVAAVVVAYTVFIDVRFMRAIHRAMADEADPTIHIPTNAELEADRHEFDRAAKLYVAADGGVYAGGKMLADADLRQFARDNAGKRIFLRVDTHTKYSRIEELMTLFHAMGVKDLSMSVVTR